MRLLECVGCGTRFEGKYAQYCEKCRAKIKTGVLFTGKMRKCKECGKEELMHGFQKRCAACIAKSKKHVPSTPKLHPETVLRRLLISKQKFEKKYFTDTRCPNYGLMGTDCLGCPDGAFEFKECGRYKQEENNG